MSNLRAYEPLKQTDSYDDVRSVPQPKRRVSRTAGFALLAVLGTIALSVFYVSPSHADKAAIHGKPLEQCASSLPPPAQPPAPNNVWAPLTVEEIVSIQKWLDEPARGLNLTKSDKAGLADNHIFLIDAYQPRKADALAYVENPLSALRPAKYARVTIHHGTVPVIKDYLIGPLPISDKSEMTELKDVYHRDEIPYHARGVLVANELAPLVLKIMAPLAEATEELFGTSALGLVNDTMLAGVSAPWSFDGTFRRAWVSWRRNVAGPWLHPLNFFQYVDMSGTDPAQWKLIKIVYNHQVFDSIDSFLDAFHNGTLQRLPERPDQRKDPSWSTRKRPNPEYRRDLDHLPGPRSVSFAGLRFRVDKELQYVSWLGWGLYLGFNRDMGLSLWDIRFRDERLIYELAPQEAIAQYAGNDPMQATTAWLDRFFGMGASVRDMLPGYDCPHEAVYLPAITHSGTGIIKRERAICIFEQDSGRPITRHTGYMKDEFGAVKGYVLTIRSISTFDYMFHVDGTIEIRLSASGYLQGGYWEPKQEGYGAQIRDTSMGSLHDHVINYKVDLDLVGLKNSLLRTTTAQEEVEHPWIEEDWGTTVIQQKISRSYIENEDDALLKYPNNFQGSYAIVNKGETNAWGSPRGYAIHPGYSPIYNTVVGSKRLLNNANWARYNLAVSRRKDNEPTSSSMWNQHLPGAPMVDFHKFFDGENITQEDLVAWVNVGMHHLPQAEDIPNTRTNLAASSFFLTPLNYFDTDVSLESINAIVLTAPEKTGDPFTFDDYGVKPANCVPEGVPDFEYSGLSAFTMDGKPAPPTSVEELRKQSELFHRIKVEM
ncbi:amine oxidase catalytic domain-containing protein [Neolentinus lepideus HHB14362 ss-1]|uniref:Amine oxidase n=1 Tax=Neolentinus lepideus HHB14362 ss-1 TaxID=1314782 RepID=A0A165P1E3_9AGAM|nr:amine oxidase catalytic domain-containing protein [Neolentinus lepideus HHB14362 ss-1]